MTVYRWDTKVDPRFNEFASQPGQMFSEIDVRACLPANYAYGRLQIDPDIREAFTLEMPNGTSISSAGIGYGGAELMGQTGSIGPGECVRGVIVFQQPKNVKPRFVVYSGTYGNLRWDVR